MHICRFMRQLLPLIFTIYIVHVSSGQVSGYKPKIMELSYRLQPGYDQTTDMSGVNVDPGAQSEVRNDYQLRLKLGVPLIMKDSVLFGLQLKYYSLKGNYQENGELFQSLNRRAFTNLGIRFLLERKLKKDRRFTITAGAEAQSDQVTFGQDENRYFVISQIQRPTGSGSLSYGFAVEYGLLRWSAYPYVGWVKFLGNDWYFDSMLPKNISLRKEYEKSFLTARFDVQGWRYNMTKPFEGDDQNYTLRRLDFVYSLIYERELSDWMLLGFETGIRDDFRYHFSLPGDGGRDALMQLDIQPSVFFKIGLYVVPPDKFLNRISK